MKEIYALFVIVGLVVTITYLYLAMSAYVKQTGKAKMRFIVSGISGVFVVVGIIGIAQGLSDPQIVTSSKRITENPVSNNDVQNYSSPKDTAQSEGPLIQHDESTDKEEISHTSKEKEIIYSLDITPKQFQKRFNSLPRVEGFENTTIESITIDTAATAFNSFQEPLSYNVDITGSVNKSDDTIAFIQVALKNEGDGRDKDIFINTIPLLISSTVPSVSDNKKEEIISKAIDNLSSDIRGIQIFDGDYRFSTQNTAFARIFRITKEIK